MLRFPYSDVILIAGYPCPFAPSTRLAFEPRFKLLPMEERKETFLHFVRHRAGELREEKREAAAIAAQVMRLVCVCGLDSHPRLNHLLFILLLFCSSTPRPPSP